MGALCRRACRRDRTRVILPRGKASHGSSCPRALPGFVRRRFFRIGRPEFGLFRSGSFSLRSGWSETSVAELSAWMRRKAALALRPRVRRGPDLPLVASRPTVLSSFRTTVRRTVVRKDPAGAGISYDASSRRALAVLGGEKMTLEDLAYRARTALSARASPRGGWVERASNFPDFPGKTKLGRGLGPHLLFTSPVGLLSTVI